MGRSRGSGDSLDPDGPTHVLRPNGAFRNRLSDCFLANTCRSEDYKWTIQDHLTTALRYLQLSTSTPSSKINIYEHLRVLILAPCFRFKMCDYTQVEYSCGHLRYTVRAWCVKYQETHKRCPANVVAIVRTFNSPLVTKS